MSEAQGQQFNDYILSISFDFLANKNKYGNNSSNPIIFRLTNRIIRKFVDFYQKKKYIPGATFFGFFDKKNTFYEIKKS